MTYDSYSLFYDQAMSDYRWCEDFLLKMIESKLKAHHSVLELGCGTGRILELVKDEFTCSSGVDISPAMLKFAKQRLPETDFYEQDMRYFKIDRSFDLILCLFDSINHLNSFDGWERTFRLIASHLAPAGVCIFDMNTPQRLARLSLFPPMIETFGEDDLLILDVLEDEENPDHSGLFHFNITIFKQLVDDTYQRYSERILEFAPTVEQVLESLLSIFSKVEIYDEDEQLVGEDISLEEAREGRLFFVCER